MEEHSQLFDICIVCALVEEANAVVHEFSDRCENIQFQQDFSKKTGYVYQHTTLKNSRGESLTVLVIGMPFTGPIETVLSVRALLEEFHPRFVAMTGICAGYREKVALGDLVAVSYSFHHDEGKVEPGEQGQDILRPEWRTHGPTRRIVQYLQAFTAWEPPLAEMKQRLLGRELQPAERPKCLIAPIASSMAVQGNNPFPRLLEHNRKAVFLDQEVAAFYQTLHESPNLSFLAVKGICDYADMRKDDTYHEYAARASAVYLLSFIQEYMNNETMPREDTHQSRTGPPAVWMLPYARNPFFIGHEDLLLQLATTLHTGEPTALSQPQAISGLGGIGKTQLALEYAYRHRQDYQAVLWALADTHEALTSSYLSIATLLNLPEKHELESDRVIAAVKDWLRTSTGWLLILDNADDLTLARDFLPPSLGGHVLLTTRAQATGRFARRLEVDILPTELGALFLLRRAGRLSPDASLEAASPSDISIAKEITEELGGLPLALDQAGAYLEETGCSLADYQHLFQGRRADLLAERRGLINDHPMPVATTWSLSFQRVESANPAAADLLRLCAFLAPDAIPETIITEGAEHLGQQLASVGTDPYLLNQTIEVLRAYSLVRREVSSDGGTLLSVHRLVQAVLKDQMDEQSRQQWAERTVRAVDAALPEVEHGSWPQWERLLAHALACHELIEHQGVHGLQAAHLLHRTGAYLLERARSREAEPLLQQALAMREHDLGLEHPETAGTIDRLARCFENQGRYTQAEPLLVRALAIREQQLGPLHPHTATSLNNLAELYRVQGKYELAEPLLMRALSIYEQILGPLHPDTATSLNNLATLYRAQGKYAEVEPLLVRALAIREQQLGPLHPHTAQSLNNLAAFYDTQGKYEQAEPLYLRTLAIWEQQLGPLHPHTATSLNNLAALYCAQGKYELAEPLCQRALVIREQQLGPLHPDTAQSLSNLAALYRVQDKYADAEPLLVRSLSICEQQLGPLHPHTATNLNNLAALYQDQSRYELAESLYVRALAICERQLGPLHPDTAQGLNNLAGIYRAQGKDELAEPLYVRALAIYEQQLGPLHPDTATSLNNLAALHHAQGKYEQVEQLLVRALAIREQQLGPLHPDTALSLSWLAFLYQQQQKYDEAEPLYRRALSIYEQQLGPQHPHTLAIRRNYALLLEQMGRNEAEEAQ